ncbi:Telomere length regulation/capping, TEN1 [Beauveria brongniartii RCEF 3172]|uniref:Telomere length regulation/capping, TEN1 n=1 Tax=Beauveria brongniartii RCEF 3172 TaxID=1081107 RepID=A0A167GXZ3_9HYPO|nr:Telomere length regulation/capping, TEN1 [Beauveria brongniartii RCEF 3172]
MSRGPLPSELCLLSWLPRRKIDDKVRFLGWYVVACKDLANRAKLTASGRSVTAYSTKTACITLGHLYPRGTNVSVTVNVELLLETLASETTRTGEWVNVIGYVKGVDVAGSGAAAVQALMVWPAGPMDIQHYEAALEEMQAAAAHTSS